MRVLLVEDDELLGDGLQHGLRQHGFTVDWLTRGDEADTALRTQSFEALVLDWQLPGQTGVALLRQLRARGDHTPVLMLTARDTVPERIEGLDAGADDYLVKPVALAELAARLRALHRRAMGRGTPQLQWGALILDPAQHQVTLEGQPVALAPREFALLARLMAQPQRPLSQAQLIEALYAWGEDIASNAVEVHVHHLRRKLGSDWIKTIRGVGYVLNPERGRP